jgi:5'-nucleotidase
MNNSDNDNLALIDLDGTVADYESAIDRELHSMQSPYEPAYAFKFSNETEPTWLKARIRLIRQRPGFWRELHPLKLGMDVVQLMRDEGYALNVLSKGPVSSTNAWTEKFEWSRQYIPDAQVTLTEEKGLVYGRVLFDDWPVYIKSWLEHRPRGLVLMTAHRWNADFTHPNVIRVTSEQDLAPIQLALRQHAQRIWHPAA